MVTAVGRLAVVTARVVAVKGGLQRVPFLAKIVVKAAPKTTAKIIAAIAVVEVIERSIGLVLEPGDILAVVGGPAGVGARVGFKIAQSQEEAVRSLG